MRNESPDPSLFGGLDKTPRQRWVDGVMATYRARWSLRYDQVMEFHKQRYIQELRERNAEVYNLKEYGLTSAEIAERMNLREDTIRQMIREHKGEDNVEKKGFNWSAKDESLNEAPEEKLVRLWNLGHETEDIISELNTLYEAKLTRSAVLAKVWRLRESGVEVAERK